MVSITALTDVGPQGRSPNISLYALSVTFASVIFGYAKNYNAALYLSASPLAGLAYLVFYGLRSDHSLFDTLLVALVLNLILSYSLRVITIARCYSTLREGDDQDTPKRRLFKR